MSSSTNQNTNDRSMSGIITIDDGNGTIIEDGVITTNGIEVNGDVSVQNLVASGEISADIFSLSFPDSSSKFQIDDVRYISKYYDEIDNKYYINMNGYLYVDGDCKVTGDLKFPTESTGLNWNNYARIYYNGADLQIETDALMNITAPSGVNISSTVSAPRVTFSSTSPNMYITTLNGNFMEFFNTTTLTAGFGFYCGTEATPVEVCRIQPTGVKADIFSLSNPDSTSKFQVDDDMYLGKSIVDSTPYLLLNGSTIVNGVLNIQDPFNNIYILDDTNFTYNANRNINSKHTFNVQGALITTIDKNGLTIPSGKYLKSPEIILGTSDLQGLLDLKAPKSNPTFTGTVTATAISTTNLYPEYIQFKNETAGTTAIGVDTTNKYMSFLSYSGGYKFYYNYGIGTGEMDLERTGVLSGLTGLQVSGTVKSQGYACNAGTTGTPTGNMFNFNWATDNNGNYKVKSYIDTTKIGSLVMSDENGTVGIDTISSPYLYVNSNGISTAIASKGANDSNYLVVQTITVKPNFSGTINVYSPLSFLLSHEAGIGSTTDAMTRTLNSCACAIYKNGTFFAGPTVSSVNGYGITKTYSLLKTLGATFEQFITTVYISFTPTFNSSTNDVYEIAFSADVTQVSYTNYPIVRTVNFNTDVSTRTSIAGVTFPADMPNYMAPQNGTSFNNNNSVTPLSGYIRTGGIIASNIYASSVTAPASQIGGQVAGYLFSVVAGLSGSASFPVFCSMTTLNGFTDRDNYWFVMGGYKIIIYNLDSYGGVSQIMDNTTGVSVKYVVPTNIRTTNSCKVYFQGVEITIAGLS